MLLNTLDIISLSALFDTQGLKLTNKDRQRSNCGNLSIINGIKPKSFYSKSSRLHTTCPINSMHLFTKDTTVPWLTSTNFPVAPQDVAFATPAALRCSRSTHLVKVIWSATRPQVLLAPAASTRSGLPLGDAAPSLDGDVAGRNDPMLEVEERDEKLSLSLLLKLSLCLRISASSCWCRWANP